MWYRTIIVQQKQSRDYHPFWSMTIYRRECLSYSLFVKQYGYKLQEGPGPLLHIGFAETQAIMACNKNAAERIKYPRRASSNKRILENEEKIRSVGGDKKIKYLGYVLKEYIYYY